MNILKKIFINLSLILVFTLSHNFITHYYGIGFNIFDIYSVFATTPATMSTTPTTNTPNPSSDEDASDAAGGSPTVQGDPVQRGLTEFIGVNPGIRTEGTLIGYIAQIIRWGLGLIGTVFFVLVLMSGFNYMTAGGDTNKAKQSLSSIANATIGLVIMIGSFLITNYILSAVLAV